MKQIGTDLLLVVLSALIFIGSTGITFTHVECVQGETWILGEKPPVCEKVQAKDICPYSGKVCHSSDKTKDKSTKKRKKRTFKAELKVVSQYESKQLKDLKLSFKKNSQLVQFSSNRLFHSFEIGSLMIFHGICDSKAPPDITNPLLSEIQVYVI